MTEENEYFEESGYIVWEGDIVCFCSLIPRREGEATDDSIRNDSVLDAEKNDYIEHLPTRIVITNEYSARDRGFVFRIFPGESLQHHEPHFHAYSNHRNVRKVPYSITSGECLLKNTGRIPDHLDTKIKACWMKNRCMFAMVWNGSRTGKQERVDASMINSWAPSLDDFDAMQAQARRILKNPNAKLL